MTTTASGPILAAPPPEIALLEDKLRIPRPGVTVLPRPRIGALLDAAVTRRVTLMTGPPGAGKTVAAALWAATRPSGRRPAWVTIDAGDGDPDRFWRYVTAALCRAGVLPLGKAGLPAGITAMEIPQWISAAIRPVGDHDPVVLVLDDVHLLVGAEPLAGLDELIRHEPAWPAAAAGRPVRTRPGFVQAPAGRRTGRHRRCRPGVHERGDVRLLRDAGQAGQPGRA